MEGSTPPVCVNHRNMVYGGIKHVQMMEEIQKELKIGVIKEVQLEEVKMLLRTFLIPKKNGEWRKILDCTPVNVYCRDIRFKMEDHRLVVQLLEKQMYGVSIDIKSAYHNIHVDQQLSQYLCFEYDKKYYQYVGMPFGVKMAPRVFSRIMHRCIVVIRHRWCLAAVQYFDDIWLGHVDKEYLEKSVREVVQFLKQLGWLINEGKSELVPRKRFAFLGWTWDTEMMTVELSREKRSALKGRSNKR
jgi:hypothetical protein